MKTGKITPNGVLLRPHELATVVFLTEQGYDIVLIPKSNKYGEHTPDIKMVGLSWEIKCPKGRGKWLIKNTIQKASHQSENITVDLHRIKVDQSKCLLEIERYFRLSKRIRRIKVITKTKRIIDFTK